MTRDGQAEVPDVVGAMEMILQRYVESLRGHGVPVDDICDNLAAAGAALGTRAATLIRSVDSERDPMMALTTILAHLEVTARNQGIDMLLMETVSRRVWNTTFPATPKCMLCGRLVEEPSPFEKNVGMEEQYRHRAVRNAEGFPEHPECHFLAHSNVKAAPVEEKPRGLRLVKGNDPNAN